MLLIWYSALFVPFCCCPYHKLIWYSTLHGCHMQTNGTWTIVLVITVYTTDSSIVNSKFWHQMCQARWLTYALTWPWITWTFLQWHRNHGGNGGWHSCENFCTFVPRAGWTRCRWQERCKNWWHRDGSMHTWCLCMTFNVTVARY